jgi:IS4 transposase
MVGADRPDQSPEALKAFFDRDHRIEPEIHRAHVERSNILAKRECPSILIGGGRRRACEYWASGDRWRVTPLPAEAFSTEDIFALYRLRWRIELAFKRLKSILGLKAPPGVDERSANPYVLVF